MSITVYGITNCDTVKKARGWLEAQGVEYTFHDFKKQGLPEKHLDAWLKAVGWEKLLNRKGTMWRKLDERTQASVHDAASARVVMTAEPRVIKRPVVEWGNGTTVGFDESTWEQRLGL